MAKFKDTRVLNEFRRCPKSGAFIKTTPSASAMNKKIQDFMEAMLMVMSPEQQDQIKQIMATKAPKVKEDK